jgi:hypothetical protein
MNTSLSPWTRLLAAARRAPADTRDASAPLGFAARIGALAFAGREPTFSALFARASWRALGVCSLLMVAGVALNYSSALKAFEPDLVSNNDPVSDWIDASSAS